MPVAAPLIGGAGAIIGGAIASSGAKKAAKAQAAAEQAAIDEQRRQYDISRNDLAPYRQVGTGALNQYAALYGIPQYTTPDKPLSYEEWAAQNGGAPAGNSLIGAAKNAFGGTPANTSGYQQYLTEFASQPRTAATAAPDYSAFYNSPDYKFGLDEGLKAVQGSAAARGGLYSGNALKALQNYGSGYASQQYGNYKNSLAALAGIGQTATNAGVAAGQNFAGNIGNLMSAQGDARASGIAGGANAWGNAIGTVAGGLSNYLYNRPYSGGSAPYTPNGNGLYRDQYGYTINLP